MNEWEPTRHGGFRRTRVAQTVKSATQITSRSVGRIHPRVLNFRFAWRERLGLPRCPYVIRWRLETPLGSVRVHHWLAPDDGRAFHDHPWWFLTFVIRGCYGDQSPDDSDPTGYRTEFLRAPAVRFRRAEHRHTVVPCPGGAWTLLVTGPARRRWGFWPGGKFVKANKWFASYGHHPCA